MCEKNEIPGEHWLLFDGDCGFCRRWIGVWERKLLQYDIKVAPLQTPWVVERLKLPEEELLKDIRLLLADGQQIQGADVYRYVMRQIWWTKPLFFLSVMPGLSACFNRAYRLFADNRQHISSTCAVEPPPRT